MRRGDRGYARISRVKKESGIWNVVGANIAASVEVLTPIGSYPHRLIC